MLRQRAVDAKHRIIGRCQSPYSLRMATSGSTRVARHAGGSGPLCGPEGPKRRKEKRFTSRHGDQAPITEGTEVGREGLPRSLEGESESQSLPAGSGGEGSAEGECSNVLW